MTWWVEHWIDSLVAQIALGFFVVGTVLAWRAGWSWRYRHTDAAITVALAWGLVVAIVILAGVGQ